jgi:hypothetical protein
MRNCRRQNRSTPCHFDSYSINGSKPYLNYQCCRLEVTVPCWSIREPAKRRLTRNAVLVILTAANCLFQYSGSSQAVGAAMGHIEPARSPIRSMVQQIAVFGEDTRTTLPRKYKALENSISLLTGRRGRARYMCSAFCVAPDIIATSNFRVLRRPFESALASISAVDRRSVAIVEFCFQGREGAPCKMLKDYGQQREGRTVECYWRGD